MNITVKRLKQIIREELALANITEDEILPKPAVTSTSASPGRDPMDDVKAWLDDRKPTTDVSRKKTASDLDKKIAAGDSGRANVDTALQGVRKDLHAKKDTDQTKQDKLAALGAALDDPETTAGYSTSSSRSKLPPMV